MPMQCPYISENEGKKNCKRMEEEGMDGKISDFDLKHYCNGSPVNCYYFRNSKHAKEQPEKGIKRKLGQIFTTT